MLERTKQTEEIDSEKGDSRDARMIGMSIVRRISACSYTFVIPNCLDIGSPKLLQ